MQEFHGKHIVIIIEGFPVPLYRILMQQAVTLYRQGTEVSIISPKMFGFDKSYEQIEGVSIYRHPMPLEANNAVGFLFEYCWALAWQFFLLLKIFILKRIHVIEGCTPPDLVFIPVLPFKLLGVKYVYYQLDLNPELYVSRYNKKDFFYKFLIGMERLTFLCADYAIEPNETFKSIAINRGKMNPENIAIIRSCPDLDKFRLSNGINAYKNGKRYLVGYVGVINRQDSVDIFIESISYIVNSRKDTHFAIVGDGPEFPFVYELARRLKVEEYITFFGIVKDLTCLDDIISTCDVCVNPDKADEYNDKITAAKIMEYMAHKKPIVQFDLAEGRFTAQQSSLYAQKSNCADFAEKIIFLLDNEDLRASMGEFGYRRIVNELSWKRESTKLLSLYDKVFS